MIIPVIRGKIGNWRYYSGLMTFEQVAEYVTTSIGELYQAQCLDELLQRELTSNYSAIKEYLLNDEERFFNALILAIYDGDPQWLEIEFENHDFCNVGFLQFSGKEVIFPVDGQHRVAGIKAAIEEKKELGKETVPVIFIAHSQTPDGRTRTRKLFSTLNRRAKPVGQNENIALDEDDVCSVITRDLIQEFPLFSNDRVVNSKGKQIPNNNNEAFTSLIALYQCVCIIVQKQLNLGAQKFKNYQLYRPSAEDISQLSNSVHELFDAFIDETDVIKTYLSAMEQKSAAFRNKAGGNILFRPIVLTNYIEVAIKLSKEKHISINEAFAKLNRIPQDLNAAPWLGLLWDGERIVNRISHTVIRNMIMYMTCSEMMSHNDCNKFYDVYAKALTTNIDHAKEILEQYKDCGEKQ